MSLPARRRLPRSPLLLLLLLSLAALGAAPAAQKGAHGMVVSSDAQASDVGLEVLRRGGNAVDASVAAALTLAVTFPEAGNLAGGGFLLFRNAAGRSYALDFRETAPRELRPSLFLGPEGRPVPERALRGGLAVAVPGSVAGLFEAHRRWGKTPWRELVAPALRLARSGFALSAREARELALRASDLAADPAARAIFFREGAPLRENERLVQKDLARSLERIARRGVRGFYEGPVAQALVSSVRASGGVLSLEDLAAYRPLLREPLVGSYRGYRIVTFPLPSSGGVALLQILGMLERHDLRASGSGSSATVHLVVEAERRAFADRARWLGDPDFVRVPLRGLIDPAYLAARDATIDPARATVSTDISAGTPPGAESEETTHVSVADAAGNCVALTTTLNSSFGAAFVAPGTGLLLNDEIDDFALAPGIVNQYGLSGGDANVLAPGKRPLSSMAPTIVERETGAGRPFLVLGSPGGSTIVSAVLEVLLNVVDHGMELQEAVNAPRFHHQWLPDRIDHEERAFAADVALALQGRGHVLAVRAPIGHVPAIGRSEDGAWLGAADARRGGKAAGY